MLKKTNKKESKLDKKEKVKEEKIEEKEKPVRKKVEVTNTLLDSIKATFKELWMEVHDIIQEEVVKIIPKKKKCKKGKMVA